MSKHVLGYLPLDREPGDHEDRVWGAKDYPPLCGVKHPLAPTSKIVAQLVGEGNRTRGRTHSTRAAVPAVVSTLKIKIRASLDWSVQSVDQCTDDIAQYEEGNALWRNVAARFDPEKAVRIIPDVTSLLTELSSVCTLANAKQIDSIREQAEEVSIEAESHLGLVVRRLPSIPLGPAPEFSLPDDVLGQIDSDALASARKLIQAVLHFAPDAEADLDVAAHGGVEVTWRSANSLIWIIDSPSMSWPAVKVRTYSRVGSGSSKLQARSFFLAHSVIEQARTVLVSK